MRDKKGAVAKAAAMGGFECARGLGRPAKETHRRCDDNGSSGRASAQKSTPADRNLATLTITHRAPPRCNHPEGAFSVPFRTCRHWSGLCRVLHVNALQRGSAARQVSLAHRHSCKAKGTPAVQAPA